MKIHHFLFLSEHLKTNPPSSAGGEGEAEARTKRERERRRRWRREAMERERLFWRI
jgi:hypothetical protein